VKGDVGPHLREGLGHHFLQPAGMRLGFLPKAGEVSLFLGQFQFRRGFLQELQGGLTETSEVVIGEERRELLPRFIP
jgi:hypothetical protein